MKACTYVRNPGKWFSVLFSFMTICGMTMSAGTVVLSDSIDYGSAAELQDVWTPLYGSSSLKTQVVYGPAPLAAEADTPASGQFISLANDVSYCDFELTVTNDWSLTAKMLHKNYSRGGGIYLLNSTGTEGYGVFWSSALVSQFGGNGYFSIRKFDNSQHTDWSSFGSGTDLSGTFQTGHPVTGYAVTNAPGTAQDDAGYDTSSWSDFVSIRLDWSAETGMLSLYEDGSLVGQVSDTEFSSFRRVYLRGNTDIYFDNIQVATTLPSEGMMFLLKGAEQYGADVPFVTYQAEDSSSVSGSVVQLQEPCPWPTTPAQEAEGRAYVELSSTGDFLEFSAGSDANAMVVRHCIPDAEAGGGMSATLGLYVNGVRRQDITLTSKYNWLYGQGNAFENGQDNTPTAYPHVFWDEARFFIDGEVSAGDIIRLQKDAQDTAAFYRIDLMDLEDVPPPLAQPANSLSVADYGASGVSADTDTAAIQSCIDAAKALGKSVWFPAGSYLQNEYVVLDGVKVQGAGMWYTFLYDTVGNAATTWKANSGFQLLGDGAGVSDLSLDSLANTRRSSSSPKSFFGNATNWVVENVWISHMGVGFWMAGHNGVIRNCRVRLTYADGINVNNGNIYVTSNVLVEHNHVRGIGDDGLAVLSHSASSAGDTDRITLRYNTVAATWWGANCDLAGGKKHLIHNNLLTDGSGFVVNLPDSYPMQALRDSLFIDNYLLRCGIRKTLSASEERAAIWVYAQSDEIHGFVMKDNIIQQPNFHGILCRGDQFQEITFRNNQITGAGRHAVYIMGATVGVGTFDGNVSTSSAEQPPFNNLSIDYTVVNGNNSWE